MAIFVSEPNTAEPPLHPRDVRCSGKLPIPPEEDSETSKSVGFDERA